MESTIKPPPANYTAGTFAYIEQAIRAAAVGTELGVTGIPRQCREATRLG
jgi:hypothetical protein